MRIGYFADGRWAHKALDRIRERSGLHVAFIVARHEQPDPVLRGAAKDLGIPFLVDADVNREAFRAKIEAYDVDLNVSMSFNQIVRQPIRELAPMGFINCHAGALPFYRGRNVLNWALINGEERFGVTVHHIDEGIDTGDIIEQQFAPIGPEDDYADVLDRAVSLCADTLEAALVALRDGTDVRIPQTDIHPVGFYCSARRKGDEWIDWTWTSERIHNLVRGIAPPAPGARTIFSGHPLAILRTEQIPAAPRYIDRPGSVVGKGKNGIIVKTGDTTLRVTRVADPEDGGLRRARVPDFRIGAVLGAESDPAPPSSRRSATRSLKPRNEEIAGT
jgi:methionyl-tRNA formyltransferase